MCVDLRPPVFNFWNGAYDRHTPADGGVRGARRMLTQYEYTSALTTLRTCTVCPSFSMSGRKNGFSRKEILCERAGRAAGLQISDPSCQPRRIPPQSSSRHQFEATYSDVPCGTSGGPLWGCLVLSGALEFSVGLRGSCMGLMGSLWGLFGFFGEQDGPLCGTHGVLVGTFGVLVWVLGGSLGISWDPLKLIGALQGSNMATFGSKRPSR